MDPNEPYSNVQNHSEPFRSVQQSSEDFSDLQSTSKRTSGVGRGKKYAGAEIPHQDIGHDFLIMEEAYTLFESQGERRSLRMIGEYCKTGELICSYDTDDKRWHITRASIEQKLSKIKALNARRAATAPHNPQHTSEPFTEPPAAPQRPPENQRPKEEVPPQSASDSSPFALIKKLRKRILNLRILNQGKDYVIEQLHQERGQLLTRIETSNRLVGELKHKLLQLEAPKGQMADSQTPFDHAVPYRDVEDVSSSQTIDPTPSVSPNEPLPNNANTYEHSPQERSSADQRQP
jgi:hypothetical protein